jgi:hypothetical protein
VSRFVLNNKLSRKAHFELAECPVFDPVPESGILPVPLILEDRIGPEMTLLLIDKTPFIYTLAKVKPFDRVPPDLAGGGRYQGQADPRRSPANAGAG